MGRFNMQDSDPTKGGVDWLTEECDAIFYIDEYKEVGNPEGDENYHCLISATVVGCTVADQIGRKIKDERFHFLKGSNRIFEFCCALGIYNKPQWQADKESGADPVIPIEGCVGRYFATPVRHKKWDPSRDPTYWGGELRDAEARLAAGGEEAEMDKAQKKIERCQRILAEKKGKIQIGGASGFVFWAVGDPEADHIAMLPEDEATLPPQGAPTKQGTFRKRSTPVGPQVRTTAPVGNGGAARQSAPATRSAAQSSKPAAAAGVGSQFM